jgi:hypothetical protein
MTNNGKGIGPNGLGASKTLNVKGVGKIAPLIAMAGKAIIGGMISKAASSATEE